MEKSESNFVKKVRMFFIQYFNDKKVVNLKEKLAK